MSRPKAEMSVEQKENGQIVEYVAYPYVEYDHVTFENGMQIEKALEDDVVMPTVTHDTSSWKAGQGDSDVSDSIVDSSVASMSIKGQTYQNILPSPTLRNSMTDGNTMQKINEGYDSVEVVDGVCKSAILSGQTLVNSFMCKTLDDFRTHGNVTISDGVYTLTGDNTWNTRMYPKTQALNVKPSTTYTLILYVEENNTINTGTQLMEIGEVSSQGVSMFNSTHRPTSLSIGTNKFLLTTKADFSASDFGFIFRFYSSVSGTLKFKMSLVEGDYTNIDIPYFEGMQSVKMPVLTVTNGNLLILSPNTLEMGSISGTTGELLQGNTRCHTTNIKVSQKDDLFLKRINCDYQVAVRYYYGDTLVNKSLNNNGSFIVDGNLKVNGGEDYDSIKLIFAKSDNSILTIEEVANQQIMLVPNNNYTTYEPHKSNILTVNQDVELRGISDVQDTLDLLTGEIVQNIGEIVIDGTQNGVYDYVTNEQLGLLTLRLPKILDIKNDGINLYGLLSDKYSSVTNKSPNNIYSYSGRIMITKELSELESFNTSDKIKLFLSQNPITLQYPLAEKSIKTVDLSVLDQDNQPVEQLQSYANGHIQLSSNVAEGEYSLTPSIEYEVPTSNSYYLDLAKPSTQYTMKNMTGTFTLDGTQYNASANGTFMSPSTLSNKFMVTSVVQSQPMLLEGDMTSEEVPYVDGIKSAFEGVDKVEIYSVGKNLFDVNKIDKSNPLITKIDSSSIQLSGSGRFDAVAVNLELEPNTTYTLGYNYNLEKGSFSSATMRTSQIEGATISNIRIFFDANTNNTEKSVQFTTTSTGKVMIRLYGCNDAQEYVTTFSNIYINKGVSVGFSPHKSNTTSFPITNPLRSLPNGERDEIVLDRMSNKAKLIQRVGEDLTQLPSPIITEVNMEGYPYVYKDGHIFLNTEVAPTSEVKYSINQSQIIESQSEDIVRHSKEIDNLYNLIATYVQVNYDGTLLNLKTKGV